MLAVGDYLQNRYRIIRQLGEGGMGAVWEAEDNQRFGKPVALKEILLNLTSRNAGHFRRAFEREAKILTQIDHEAVPKVIGYILETDYQILVMELIEGDDLDEILEKRRKPFRLGEVLDWADQLLDALDYLHTLHQPIIHRDIKPQNLKLTKRKKVKLLDFGIAKDTEAETGSTKSLAHKTFIGATLYYSPLEQIIRVSDYFEMIHSIYPEKAEKIARESSDARSDIYALGATLYHLLSNVYPKPAHLRALEIWSGRSDSLIPLPILNPQILPEIAEVLHKAMEIERENRYASAQEMQIALQEAISREKRRSEAEERYNLVTEQERIRRERAELEAERRQLAAERKKHDENESEAARRRKEEREYEEKLKKWKLENLKHEKKSAEEKPPPDTQPSVEVFLTEKSFNWADIEEKKELEEKKEFMETSSPSFLIDFEFETGPPPKPFVQTIESVKPLTAPNISAPTDANKKKPFWILPVAAVVIFIFGIGALGILLIFINSNSTSPNKSIPNTKTTLPTASPTISPSPTPEPSVSPTNSLAQTNDRTTTQNQIKTPAVQKNTDNKKR
ncbi:hypothetical protein BH10ACI1_BH10ACI1_21560 [soil metagenome]